MPRRVAWLALAVALAGATAITPRMAAGTSVVPITVEELTHRADDVVVVTPRAQRSQWLAGAIVTDVDLEVESVLRGRLAAHDRVTLRLPGGVVGRVGQQVPGVASLEIGRSYMVFMSRASDAPGTFYLTHLTAGVLVITTSASGTPMVIPPGEGLVVTSGPTAITPTQTPVTMMRRTGVPLDGLVRTVRSVR